MAWGFLRNAAMVAIALAAMGSQVGAAQSVVLTQKFDLTRDAALAVASAKATGDLHTMRPRLQQRARCDAPVAQVVEASAAQGGETATLPAIVVCGTPARGEEIPQGKSVELSVESARARALALGVSSPIRGAPALGHGFAAWTDPGNIQYWLSKGW